ncbi:DUF4350 domain-containing protein [Bacillus rubiinfantis]|uniref:DUF4350 domain-containing protein n=1 Tax=Bacillus rubiinfantis TaxID=1499680 RepID=UPI000A68B93C|nr:DUF4350 domain-containing protein [Bacillus rubiinfantis]
MKKAKQSGIWLAALVIMFMIVSYFAFSPKPKLYPSYDSQSPSPTGIKALYTYLNKELEAKRWSHEPEYLSKEKDGKLLLMVEPRITPDSEEMKTYVEFIKAGNTILLLKTNPKGMFDVNTDYVAEDAEEGAITIHDSTKKSHQAEVSSYVRLETKAGDERLLYDDAGTIALKRTIGEGQLIVAVTPQWLMNSNILKHEHLQLAVQLLNQSKATSVLVDEYLHGAGETPSPLTVYPQWFLIFLAQGIIAAVLWLWLKGKRFGPIFTPREASVRFSDEGIRALAAWYLRGHRYHDSLLMQADYVKVILQEKWYIPYNRGWNELASDIERRWKGIKPGELRAFLTGLSTVLEKEMISKQEYLLWSQKLDRLQKEVEQG